MNERELKALRRESEQMSIEALKELIQLEKDGEIESCEWLTAQDGESCESCESMAGKIMKPSEVPFAFHPDCDHPFGCRCLLVAVFD